MVEYIEREKVLAYLNELEPCLCRNIETRKIFSATKDEDLVAYFENIPAANVRPVVVCADCKWWTKQEASLQGRCELLQMYPTGAWFCANGNREES